MYCSIAVISQLILFCQQNKVKQVSKTETPDKILLRAQNNEGVKKVGLKASVNVFSLMKNLQKREWKMKETLTKIMCEGQKDNA